MAEPSPAEAGESTEQRPAEGCRTVHVTVTTRYPALFSIRYRDQLELYEKFKRKLKKLGIPRDQLYWMDYKGDRQWVDGFDDFAFCAHAMSDVYCFPHVTLYAAALREELETSGGRHPKQRKSRRRSPNILQQIRVSAAVLAVVAMVTGVMVLPPFFSFRKLLLYRSHSDPISDIHLRPSTMSQQSVHAEESTELPSSEPAKVTVEQPTAGDENSLAVKVHLHTPTTFTISYNDNNELYWKFEEKLRKLGLARDKVRLIYSETGQRLPIRNIYDMDLISSVGPTIQLYAPAPAENEIQKEGKRSRSPDGLHVAKFTLRQHSIPQFAVTYKNKDELYRGFIESLEKLQISPDTLYYIREDVDELAQVKDADELMAFARGQSFVSLYSRSEAEYEISFERMHTPAVPPPHMGILHRIPQHEPEVEGRLTDVQRKLADIIAITSGTVYRRYNFAQECYLGHFSRI
ncbi:unnamed protein product [Heligmosomoides polygyrus]|uniref:Ubiquitin-like domain-containing protein n=1 Tax=Heligmosomoides polygyrus TaxID=6339 RepID=A0A183GL83_HELPZ|nr:unnamed protein product [Heligmosomoides polygyrus]